MLSSCYVHGLSYFHELVRASLSIIDVSLCGHIGLDPCETVSKFSSNKTCNCGETLPVLGLKHRGMLPAWCGEGPMYMH